jgi:MSHA biogenesis protein MshI
MHALFSFLKKKKSARTVGLEIRRDGVAMAEARPDPATGRMRVVACEFRGPDNSESVETLCAGMVREHALEGAVCHLVLPTDEYQTFPVEKPKVDASEVVEAVKWKVKDLLDFDLAKAVIDAFPLPADAARGRAELMNVVVCRRELIQKRVDLIRELGLVLDSIDIADLALRNLCLQLQGEPENTRAQALLHLRDGAGMMVMVRAQDLYMARHFDFSVSSLNDPSRQDQVIQQLGLEIQRSFDYFESQMGQVPPPELILFGPDPSLPLANMIGGSIAARVSTLDPAQSWLVRGADASWLDEVNSFVAQGAALRGANIRAAD